MSGKFSMAADDFIVKVFAIMSPVTKPDWIVILKALAEENRLGIVRLLIKEPLGVNDISERLDLPEYGVSKHLRVLREAGLLEQEKQGQRRIYAISEPFRQHLDENSNVLDLGCCLFRFDRFDDAAK